jgi:hypothetical protein
MGSRRDSRTSVQHAGMTSKHVPGIEGDTDVVAPGFCQLTSFALSECEPNVIEIRAHFPRYRLNRILQSQTNPSKCGSSHGTTRRRRLQPLLRSLAENSRLICEQLIEGISADLTVQVGRQIPAPLCRYWQSITARTSAIDRHSQSQAAAGSTCIRQQYYSFTNGSTCKARRETSTSR